MPAGIRVLQPRGSRFPFASVNKRGLPEGLRNREKHDSLALFLVCVFPLFFNILLTLPPSPRNQEKQIKTFFLFSFFCFFQIDLSDKIVYSWLGENRMVETETEKSQNPWMDGQDSAVESRVEEVGLGSTATQSSTSDVTLGFGERAVSAAGAAFLSAIIVNPLDVVKVRTCPCFFFP